MGKPQLFRRHDGAEPVPLAAPPGMPAEWQARAIALGLALEFRTSAMTPAEALAAARSFETYITGREAGGDKGGGQR